MNKLIVIAGWGAYPRLLIEGAKKAGEAIGKGVDKLKNLF